MYAYIYTCIHAYLPTYLHIHPNTYIDICIMYLKYALHAQPQLVLNSNLASVYFYFDPLRLARSRKALRFDTGFPGPGAARGASHWLVSKAMAGPAAAGPADAGRIDGGSGGSGGGTFGRAVGVGA